ncbi:hypothetical protein KDA00_00350, partial [Candidatus Saccharibacteria bacterium]|nr:hypothetical protein [Candidatus Saccharibacteria bacterium]
DNYLCYYKSTNIVLEFHYTTTGRPASDGITYNCDKVGITSWDDADTSGSSHTWSDNYLCQNVLPPFDYNESNASNNIAEVFNFSPEMYLSTPPGFQEQGGLESGKYNSIRTLPPLL